MAASFETLAPSSNFPEYEVLVMNPYSIFLANNFVSPLQDTNSAEMNPDDTMNSPTRSSSGDEATSEQNESNPRIMEFFQRISEQTDREELKLTLAEFLSIAEEQDLQDWISQKYLACCMPRARDLHSLTNSELVRTFGETSSGCTALNLENYQGALDWLNSSATEMIKSYGMRDSVPALDKAETFLRRALSLCAPQNVMRSWFYHNLAQVQLLRFQRMGEIRDLNDAFTNQLQAIQCNTSDDPVLNAQYYLALGTIHGARFARFGNLNNANEAIDCLLQTIPAAAEHPEFFNGLGNAYIARYERTGSLSDLETASENLQHAVTIAQQLDKQEPSFLTDLSACHLFRLDRFDSIHEVTESIKYAEQALEWETGALSDRPMCLGSLGAAYCARFKRTNRLVDIEESIACHQAALSLLTERHPFRLITSQKLAEALEEKFVFSENIKDIDDCIEILLEAWNLEIGNQVERVNLLASGLGDAYELRFKRLGVVSDLDQSLAHRSTAVELIPDDHPQFPSRLCELASSHFFLFDRFGDYSNINKAIQLYQKATDMTPDDHPRRPSCLYDLGRAYMHLFEGTQDITDLNKAILSQVEAVKLQGRHAILNPIVLNNLCSSYLFRYTKSNEVADITKAIACATQAVELLPNDHADRLQELMNLGYAYKARYLHDKNMDDMDEAIKTFSTAALLSTGHPNTRFEASRQWATLSEVHGEAPSIDGQKRLMELLPSVVWLGASVSQRYHEVTELGDAVATAVRAAIYLRKLGLALEWFERGRSIVWKQDLQLKSPQQILGAIDSDLAADLKRTAESLTRVAKRGSSGEDTSLTLHSGEQSARLRRRLAFEWEDLMKKIDSTLGEENPYRPKAISELLEAAHSGVVAMINLTEGECDVLIIRPNSSHLEHLPLPSVSPDKVAAASLKLRKALDLSGVHSRQHRGPVFHPSENSENPYKEVLALLWTDIVHPILSYLGYQPQSDIQKLPRITWCTTGPLAFLPLHAAGLYDKGHPTSRAFNYVISSYTPTLTALLTPRNPTPHFQGILGVGQASLGTLKALPATVKELDVISGYANPLGFTRLDENQATPNAVLEAMRSHSWVHLACHAEQNEGDPTKSCFHLHGGTLDLSTIAEEPLEYAEFAFLSACQTASGHDDLPDESVHLAAGMLMAGYRTVIATMWAINDNHAPLVADKVYNGLFENGVPDYTRAARALHVAVQNLRDTIGEERFAAWIPFIHIGL